MKIKKYGIWRVRYAYNSRKICKGWLLKNGQSLLFSSEHNALNNKKYHFSVAIKRKLWYYKMVEVIG